MQTTLPTHHAPAPQAPAQPFVANQGMRLGTILGPIGGAINLATGAGISAIVITACALLGEKILQAAGNDAYNLPSYSNMLVPALVGTSVVFGGLGLFAGCINPDR